MKKIFFTFFIFIFIFVVYFLFTPLKVCKKKVYHIDSSLNVNEPLNKSISNFDDYFYSDKECGFFSFDKGMYHYYESIDDEYILANKYFYLVYKKIGGNIQVFNPSGELISEIKIVGYPYVLKEFPVIFILKTNAMGFSLFTMKGELILDEIDFASMITSIKMDKNSNILVSTLSGSTYLFSITGDRKFKTDYHDSKINITKSSAINIDGKRIAVCSGLHPEFVDIYDVETGTMTDRIKTETNFRYSTYLSFVDNRLYYEGENQVNFYDYSTKRKGCFKINGSVNEINFDNNGNILVLSSKDALYYLTIFSSKGEKKYYKEFASIVSNFECNNNMSYFRLLDLIIKIKYGYTV